MFERLMLHKKTQSERKASCLLLAFGAVLVGAAILRLTGLKLPVPEVPVLAQAPGLVEFASVESAANQTSTPISLPPDLLGSAVQVVGLYPQATELLPANSVAVILVKDGWRFAELFYKPGIGLDQEKNHYLGERTEALDFNGRPAVLVYLDPGYKNCSSPNADRPGLCLLDKKVFFIKDGILISVAGDEKITLGELLLLARSVIGEPLPVDKTQKTE
jgi:hypothetical protein